MGKRKERRLAAKMATGRRVKLDLDVEPPGDVAGTSEQNELGGDIDQDHSAVVPTSPSSSGQRQDNPLLLLGQYSDDELDEETSKRQKLDADYNSSDGLDIEEPTEILGGTEKAISGDKQQPDQVDTVENLAGSNFKENDSTNATAEDKETDQIKQIIVPEPTRVQVDGDLAGGWKLVMHEESNQYYYWNTVTGETSWEVPTILAEQAVGAEGDGLHLDAPPTESAAYPYASVVNQLGDSHPISKITGDISSALENGNGEVALMGYDANQAVEDYGGPATLSYLDPSVLSGFGSSLQMNATSMGHLSESHASNGECQDKHCRKPDDCHGTEDIHASRLVKWCENLLGRLEELSRYGNHFEGYELLTKEIEIRLSDCKALSPYGPSLLPFWWHTEAQLNNLESSVKKGETLLIVPATHGDVETTQESHLRDIGSLQRTELESELLENENGMSPTEKSPVDRRLDQPKLQSEAYSQILVSKDAESKGLSFASQHLGTTQNRENFQDSNLNTGSANLEPEVEVQADLDTDMDVEMEVDEEHPSNEKESGGLCNTECSSASGQVIQLNQTLAEIPSLPSDEPSVPPPPDDEWIPPPPPDIEPVPPPPPEEPPISVVSVPYPDTVTSHPYPDQFSIGCNAPSYEYYASTAEVTGINYYAQVQDGQVIEPQPPAYYEHVVTNSAHEPAVNVNPVEAVYYDSSNVTVPSGSVVTSTESSGYYIQSGPFSYHGSVPASDHTGAVGFTMETGGNSIVLPKVNTEHEAPATGSESQASLLQAAFAASSVHSGGNSSNNGSAMDVIPTTSSKSQTKAVRRKKHNVAVAPSLRSNKKVSSLVNKWKAAKEELHSEEEDEPDNPSELLEKKRQKEIKEWRARQIASGEAQDNVNFLPLGGDWRERVKRKKAAAAAKTTEVSTPTEVVDKEKQKPDLVELSKGLPSGWQAYWDESTKDVYYGNTITSETTWTRPTR